MFPLCGLEAPWWLGPVDFTVRLHWLPELCLAHGDIRQPAAGPMASFLLPWAWEANTANCKWAPTLTLFCTHPVEAPHKSGLGQVNGNGHLWTSKPNCANRKTLIHLKLPRRKSFKEMQRKHLIWLIWCGFNWKLGHGLNYLRVS